MRSSGRNGYRKKVHDENAWTMDGVFAHIGIFSTAADVCKVMMAFSEGRKNGGILTSKTAMKMSALQVEEDGDRRWLMWQQRSNAENAYTRVLSNYSYGHGGFTGCFAWNDSDRSMNIVFYVY